MKIIYTLIWSFILIACVDQLQFKVDVPDVSGISISGFISDQPGPYKVTISRSFDIQSKSFLKVPFYASKVILSDNKGNVEELADVGDGVYQTVETGIRGEVGGVYKLRVELRDGRIYESLPDTLLSAGQVDSTYYVFSDKQDAAGSHHYGYDIFADASKEKGSSLFMINLIGTYKSITHPEWGDPAKSACNPKQNGTCNYLPICSGIENLGSNARPYFERVRPCECCTCWYNFYNDKPILSDAIYNGSGNYSHILVDNIPIDGWIFMFKVHVQVSVKSLTKNSFHFMKSIRDQSDAIGSLFQPITGKVPNSFIQLAGTEAPMQGLFYATSIKGKSFYIERDDIPDPNLIPIIDYLELKMGLVSCLEMFPYATTEKPSFWTD